MNRTETLLQTLIDNSGVSGATELTLDDLRDRTPIEAGTPSYVSGTGGGTVAVAAGKRVQGIWAYAVTSDGTFTVDGGTAITVRTDSGREWNPQGNWVGPIDIVFSSSLDYLVTLTT